MKILAIESSALVASVAILEDNRILAQYTTDHKKTHSQTLLPAISEIVEATDTDLATIDAIAVAGGPGSFTGLRIGGTTAKGLGLALNKPLIHVPTLKAMAYNFISGDAYICPIMDARRGQVYTAIYRVNRGSCHTVLEQCAMDIHELLAYISEHISEEIMFMGDGVPVFESTIINARQEGVNAIFAAPNLSLQQASSVAILGKEMFERGEYINADDFVPEYLRQSQAEREYTEVYKVNKDSESFDDDIKFIAALESECMIGPWSEESLKSHFANSCNGALIAKHKNEPCGYVLYQKIAGDGELFRIAVKENYRRAGIAKRLLSIMHDDANTDFWSLEVRSGNAPAIKLYEACGYKAVRYRQDYYSEPTEDAVIMEYRIRE